MSSSRQWNRYGSDSRYRDERSHRQHDWRRERDSRFGAPASKRSRSRSPSPDPEIERFLRQQQDRPVSPQSEAYRAQRIAAGGVVLVKGRAQKEKEEAERKRKEAEEDVAQAYRSFVKDMQGGADTRQQRQWRPGSSSNFVRAGGGTAYEGGAVRAQLRPDVGAEGHGDRADVGTSEADPHSDMDRSAKAVPGKRKSMAMQDFLGEIQRSQARSEERLRSKVDQENSISSLLAREARDSGPSRERPDPGSCNVCVLNLPARVSEDSLGQHFSMYGDIASVKIVWPRGEEGQYTPGRDGHKLRTTRHEGAIGFINYMRRDDAQNAHRLIEGMQWQGSTLRSGWGKSFAKPTQPLYTYDSVKERDQASGKSSRSSKWETTDADARMERGVSWQSAGERNAFGARSPSPKTVLSLRISRREGGGDTLDIIRSVSTQVREGGPSSEDALHDQASSDPSLSFLKDSSSDEYQLFRCLVNHTYTPPTDAPAFADEGNASIHTSDSEEETDEQVLTGQKQAKVLGSIAQSRLDAMLRGLTLRRERIAQIMLFAIERASCAETISRRLVESLLLPSTPLPRKLARLYAVSDILHNSSAPKNSAWRYRSLFESHLDSVFVHWGDVANSFPGRIKRESCKDMVRAMLDVWDTWLVFSSSQLDKWRSYVDGGRTSVTDVDVAHDRIEAKDETSRSSRGGPMLRGDGEAKAALTEEGIDGEALQGEDIDGEAINEGDIDGEAMDEEDIDGEAIDDLPNEEEDIDGEAMSDDTSHET